ncbi:MAG: OmpA family protein [Pseudomonadota bacterium]
MLKTSLSILMATSLLAIDATLVAAQTTGNAEADQQILQRQRELLIQKRQQQQKTRTLLEINPNTGQTETSSAAAAASTDSTVLSSTPEPEAAPKVAKTKPLSREEAAVASLPSDLTDEVAELAPEDQLSRPIKFAYDSAFLTSEARSILDGLCGTLKVDLSLNPGSSYFVIGHTDAAGSDEYNKALSQRRAEATKQHLVDGCGLATAQIEAVGMGEQRLLANVDPRAASQRRVEIQVNIGDGS